MDNTNIKELSEFEEYKNGLYESAVVDDNINGLLPIIPFYLENEEFRHARKLFTNVIAPLVKSIGYIFSNRIIVSLGQKMYETEMLDEYQSLTYGEFYDRINMLPTFLVKKILGELNCTTSIFEDLLSFIYNQNKLEAIELMRNNNLDISLLSKKVILLTTLKSYSINYQKLYNDEITPEEYIQQIQEVIAKNVDIEELDAEISMLKDWVTDYLEVMSKLDNVTNDTEEETLDKEILRLLISFPDLAKPLISIYWVIKDMSTIFESKVLNEILMRDPAFYNELRKFYDYNYNLEPLELPLGIFEKELNDIYNRIEKFCPRGQNFLALFGYGKLSRIIWTGGWLSLSYFLKVLYSGRLEEGKIKFKKSVPTNIWDNAVKLFVDNNHHHPILSSLNTRSIRFLQEKAFAGEIDSIFINVFKNIETRKS